ncbi:MAG: hypothetical protein JWN69_1742, partial [Alphaproteobacteria bacterium]|nr:hypothetical protein [Alphaproteobacteria bacterium]
MNVQALNVQALKPARSWGIGSSGLTPTMLNHAAWVTHD